MDRATIVERYDHASASDDFETMGGHRHPEWRMTWPQSGETIIGHENYVAMRTNRPEGGGPRVEPIGRGGSGDLWWSEGIIHYGDGSRWLGVWIYEFAGDLIRRERVYFGQPFAPPTWRARWVEKGVAAIA